MTQVAAGRYHTAVCTESELFTWGQNEGQLGYPKTDVTQNTPKQVCQCSQFSAKLQSAMLVSVGDTSAKGL